MFLLQGSFCKAPFARLLLQGPFSICYYANVSFKCCSQCSFSKAPFSRFLFQGSFFKVPFARFPFSRFLFQGSFFKAPFARFLLQGSCCQVPFARFMCNESFVLNWCLSNAVDWRICFATLISKNIFLISRQNVQMPKTIFDQIWHVSWSWSWFAENQDFHKKKQQKNSIFKSSFLIKKILQKNLI